MTYSIYQASAPLYIAGLTNLGAILGKAEAYAEAKKFDPAVLVNARLAPDMIPLSGQIQIASDTSKGSVARLSGVEAPSMADTEKTMPELRERLEKTVAYIKSVDAARFDGAEDRTVTMKFPQGEMKFTGAQYLASFGLPNFYFHITTAYAILRQSGVEIGKMDFLGGR